MKNNKLTIRIKKSIDEVFLFTITPPNTLKWTDSTVSEETNDLPIRVGTIYTLKDKNAQIAEYTVTALEEDKLVEWTSKDKNYHTCYTFTPVDENTTDFEYYEWVDNGDIAEPFIQETLEKLKSAVEYK